MLRFNIYQIEREMAKEVKKYLEGFDVEILKKGLKQWDRIYFDSNNQRLDLKDSAPHLYYPRNSLDLSRTGVFMIVAEYVTIGCDIVECILGIEYKNVDGKIHVIGTPGIYPVPDEKPLGPDVDAGKLHLPDWLADAY